VTADVQRVADCSLLAAMSMHSCTLRTPMSDVQIFDGRANPRTLPCRLLYRSHTVYDEAIKCYKNALRMDPESQQVMRDLATLQASKLL
jgi:hypothetical protein